MTTISINRTTEQKPRLDIYGQSYMKYRSNSTKTYWRCIKYSRDLCHSRLHTCIITNDIIQPLIQHTCTQVENYGPVPAGKHRKSLEHGSSIPTGKFSDFFRWFPTGSCRKAHEIDWNLSEKNPTNFRSEYCFHFRLFLVLSCRILRDPLAVIFDMGEQLIDCFKHRAETFFRDEKYESKIKSSFQ